MRMFFFEPPIDEGYCLNYYGDKDQGTSHEDAIDKGYYLVSKNEIEMQPPITNKKHITIEMSALRPAPTTWSYGEDKLQQQRPLSKTVTNQQPVVELSETGTTPVAMCIQPAVCPRPGAGRSSPH